MLNDRQAGEVAPATAAPVLRRGSAKQSFTTTERRRAGAEDSRPTSCNLACGSQTMPRHPAALSAHTPAIALDLPSLTTRTVAS